MSDVHNHVSGPVLGAVLQARDLSGTEVAAFFASDEPVDSAAVSDQPEATTRRPGQAE